VDELQADRDPDSKRYRGHEQREADQHCPQSPRRPPPS
jgi:hypothetical protein